MVQTRWQSVCRSVDGWEGCLEAAGCFCRGFLTIPHTDRAFVPLGPAVSVAFGRLYSYSYRMRETERERKELSCRVRGCVSL